MVDISKKDYIIKSTIIFLFVFSLILFFFIFAYGEEVYGVGVTFFIFLFILSVFYSLKSFISNRYLNK